MTTLKDLSRSLGLSVTQVSRALNNHSDVSEATKSRVKEAAIALNYKPNITARRLVSGRSGIVGLVLPGLPDPSESWMFTQFVGGLSAQFSKLGRQFMLHIASDDATSIEIYDTLTRSQSIDGFVVESPLEDDERVAFLRKNRVPFVLHGQTMDTPDYPFYDIDNFAVGYELTAHLTQNGHTHIAIINGPPKAAYAQRRFKGYAQALSERGLPVRPELHRTGDMTAENGLVETILMFRSMDPAPTAIIAGNMRIAKGILQAFSALGLRCPDDVSLVVHDDRLPDTPRESLPVRVTATISPLGESWQPLAELLDAALKGAPLERLQKFGAHEFTQEASVRTILPKA